MKKKYLKTPEDVIALKDTDTKIYTSFYKEKETYYKFVNGFLCRFDSNGIIKFNDGVYLKAHDFYIYEEEPMQEATEADIGKLCWFWDSDDKSKQVGLLRSADYYGKKVGYESSDGLCYSHCCRLSSSEVAELTGYKVKKAE